MPRGNECGKVDELKIDKDCFVDQDWIDDYIHRIIIPTCRTFGTSVNSIKMCPSRRKGLHFYISITPPVEASLANKLQWLLGDDTLRVDFNRARIESGVAEWNKLFEVPGRRLRVIYRTEVPKP